MNGQQQESNNNENTFTLGIGESKDNPIYRELTYWQEEPPGRMTKLEDGHQDRVGEKNRQGNNVATHPGVP